MKATKLKPLSVKISEVLRDGEKGLWNGDEMVAELVPWDVDENGLVSAISVLKSPRGDKVGELRHSMPISLWKSFSMTGKPVGRPENVEKKLAVFLAWCRESRDCGKFGMADERVSQKFEDWGIHGFSDASKVRKLRTKLAKRFGIDISVDALDIGMSRYENVGFEGVFLFLNPRWSADKVKGKCVVWCEAFRDRVAEWELCAEIDRDQWRDDVLTSFKNKGGPIIIVQGF